MSSATRLKTGVIGLAVLIAVGTTGYVVFEGATPLNALYLVMITITTVGFGEIIALDAAGRILTMGVMVTGIGLTLYTASAGIEQLFLYGSTRETSRTLKRIAQMENHVVVCGYGRVGAGVVSNLAGRGYQCVVIERDETLAQAAGRAGLPIVEGNATHNDVLTAARIENARSVVACVTDDADNLVIVLSARSLAPDVHIVARASESEWVEKLRLAGADRVVLPQLVGSERLAAMAVETTIAEVFEVVVGGRAIEFTVEELMVGEDSPVAGLSIREAAVREQSGALILAVENQARTSLMSPSPDHVLEPGTVVIVVGTEAELERVERLLG